MNVTRTITETVIDVVDDQSWFLRRKESIALVASNLTWMAALGTIVTDTLPRWAQLILMVLGGVGTVAGVVATALTKAAITPSMGPRLEAAAAPEPVFSTLHPFEE
ncbi:MAG: hypothetical protein Q4G46_13305 [Propionibacteriaceae bacterium]|nr:hypothetical protein [Propionibacteriaceae bacterium]